MNNELVCKLSDLKNSKTAGEKKPQKSVWNILKMKERLDRVGLDIFKMHLWLIKDALRCLSYYIAKSNAQAPAQGRAVSTFCKKKKKVNIF